jgi:hypothetical protein
MFFTLQIVRLDPIKIQKDMNADEEYEQESGQWVCNGKNLVRDEIRSKFPYHPRQSQGKNQQGDYDIYNAKIFLTIHKVPFHSVMIHPGRRFCALSDASRNQSYIMSLYHTSNQEVHHGSIE